MAAAVYLAGAPTCNGRWWAGSSAFGFAFAVNSSVHSYLVLAYAGSEKAAEDVGFYYAANALGTVRRHAACPDCSTNGAV
jgi:hypothetical protein